MLFRMAASPAHISFHVVRSRPHTSDYVYVPLEFTRPMDAISSLDKGDWAERKELEKNMRYTLHRFFINHSSALRLKRKPWNCSQINLMVGARGYLKQTQFQERFHLLGVTNSKAKRQNPSAYGSLAWNHSQAFPRLHPKNKSNHYHHAQSRTVLKPSSNRPGQYTDILLLSLQKYHRPI